MTKDAYRDTLRLYLRDEVALNILLDFKEESPTINLDLYLEMALSNLNNLPPHLGSYTFDSFPYSGLLIYEACLEALISNGILNQRNQLTYNDGGITVNHPDGNKYSNSINVLLRRSEFGKKSFQSWKVNLNVNAGWGGSSSPYGTINAVDSIYQLSTLST